MLRPTVPVARLTVSSDSQSHPRQRTTCRYYGAKRPRDAGYQAAMAAAKCINDNSQGECSTSLLPLTVVYPLWSWQGLQYSAFLPQIDACHLE